MNKESIAVYNPQDPWERAIQEASHEATGYWLSAYECQLLAKSVFAIKHFTNWTEQTDLADIRAFYFFREMVMSGSSINSLNGSSKG